MFIAVFSRTQHTAYRQLLSEFDLTIGEAEQFQNSLTSRLAMLDTINMKAIMGNEDQVAELMTIIDAALNKANELDSKLDELDDSLAVC